MKKYYLLNLVVLLASLMHAQNIQLDFEGKTRTIKAGTFVEVEIKGSTQQPCEKCKGKFERGRIINYENGILHLKVIDSYQAFNVDQPSQGYVKTHYSNAASMPEIEIAKSDILSLKLMGKRKLTTRNPAHIIGGTLVMMGLGTLLSTPFAEESKDQLLPLGMAEMAIGIILASSFKKKTFVTHPDCPSLVYKSVKVWGIK